MRVLHVAGQLRSSPGILRQMEWEQEAANALGLDWSSILVRPRGVSPEASPVLREIDLGHVGYDLRTWWSFRRAYYGFIANMTPTPDVILLRHNFHDPLQSRFIEKCLRTLTVHHVVEDAEIRALGGRSAWLKAALERRFGGRSIRGASGLIGLTDEILTHEQSRAGARARHRLATVYPNGRLLDDSVPPDERNDVPTLAFIASEFSPWQGLEDLLSAVESSTGDMRIELIGGLSEEQIARCASLRQVVVHGMLDADGIDRVLRRSWLGLAPLRADAQGLTQTCSLKVRDYLAAGVPVASGQADVLPTDFPYFRLTGADLHVILQAAHEWRDVDRLTVREAARPHIDKVELVRRLHSELEAVFAEPDA